MTARLPTALRSLARLPALALLGLIALYQRTLSPELPVLFGPSIGCRFAPTCSHYAADAVRTRGAVVGSVLALVRLLKCTPLHPGGLDPVPDGAGGRRTGDCQRAAHAARPDRGAALSRSRRLRRGGSRDLTVNELTGS